ncbi:MAG: stage V sporulation protein AC [Oscillospiraceae bacterium]|nr:stage V sporulation protein AC [Oscillospiraceae bacterium]
MNMSNAEYSRLTDKMSPRSPMLKNIFMAFIFGGLICAAGQGLYSLYGSFGLSEENVAMAVPITLILAGALLTGLKVFDNIAKHAGAGTLVPITGFANAVVSPAMEFKSEGLVLGLSSKMFSIAGPVLVFGISASVIYGIVLFLLKL